VSPRASHLLPLFLPLAFCPLCRPCPPFATALPQPAHLHVRAPGWRHQAGAATDTGAALQFRPTHLLLHPFHPQVGVGWWSCRCLVVDMHRGWQGRVSVCVHLNPAAVYAPSLCCSGGVGMNLIGADTVIFYDSGQWEHGGMVIVFCQLPGSRGRALLRRPALPPSAAEHVVAKAPRPCFGAPLSVAANGQCTYCARCSHPTCPTPPHPSLAAPRLEPGHGRPGAGPVPPHRADT
jgi:hypothetical protein